MSTPAQRVAFDLLCKLGARTHFKQYDETGSGSLRRGRWEMVPQGRTPAQTERLGRRINELARKGLNNAEIALECSVSKTTVRKHLDRKILGLRSRYRRLRWWANRARR